MRPEKYDRGTALRVFWVDSAQSSGWRYEENPPVHIEEVVTLGFVANTSDKGISLTTSMSDNGGILSMVMIPWEAITRIQELESWGRYDNLFPDDMEGLEPGDGG